MPSLDQSPQGCILPGATEDYNHSKTTDFSSPMIAEYIDGEETGAVSVARK